MKVFGAICAGILALLLIVGLAVGIWHLGWFIEEKNVDRQVHIDNRNTGTQTAWHDQAIQAISDYNKIPANNTAARGALRTQACDLIGRLVDEYKDPIILEFEATQC